ncbi:MAG: LPP20 family lipoprotein [Deltaproteobacteria bacterium]|jgi:hypothetical protein|nr:LPP20 family lipoprotein [Deltaproteobacteria bacterium]
MNGDALRRSSGLCRLLFALPLLLAACAAPEPERRQTEAPPDWYFDREAGYPSARYVSGAGTGRTRKEAEAQAVSALALFFETNIAFSGEIFVEARESGAPDKLSVSRDTRVKDTISLNTQKELFGVRFEAAYLTEQRQWAALVSMDRREASAIYTGLIMDNMLEIEKALELAGREEDPWRASVLLQKVLPDGLEAEKHLKILRLLADEPSSSAYVERQLGRLRELKEVLAARRAALTFEVLDFTGREDAIRVKIENLLRAGGFALRRDNPAYLVVARLNCLEEERPGLKYNVSGSLEINVEHGGKIVFSYSGIYERVGHPFSRALAFSMLRNEIEQDLENNFMFAFSSALGLE